jgi:methyl-accepting chemotaxis protein
MQEQSARLSQVVGVFKLNQLAAPPSRIAVRQAAVARPAPAPRQISRASAAPANAKDEWEEF